MSHDFECLDSELLLDAPIIAVRRDRMSMPQGRVASREVVEHFGAVAVVALDGDPHDPSVVLIRQFRTAVGRRLLELPAGLLDIYGEDPWVCAQRELYEEAGLKADTWDLLLDAAASPGFSDEAVRIFLARGVHSVGRPEAHDEEADLEIVTMPLGEAVQAVFDGRVDNAFASLGLLAAWHAVNARADVQLRDVSTPFVLRPTALAARRHAEGFDADMKKIPAEDPHGEG